MKMIKRRLLMIAAMAIIVTGALASASAQKASPIPVIEPLNGVYSIAVNATELSPGETEYAMAETYGWTCYGKTSGDLTGFMFFSMNYAQAGYEIAQTVDKLSSPPQPIGTTSQVTGGSWSKLIFVRGQYVGSVNGRIVGGTLTWSKTDLTVGMSLELTADDGTGYFAGSVGTGRFQGDMVRSEKAGGVMKGVLTLKY